jgi:hypothetical protein
MRDHLGYFEFDYEVDRGVICISDSQGREGLIDTFMEEYAHARCSHLIDTEDNDADPHHHPSFWAEYGRLVKAAREIAW